MSERCQVSTRTLSRRWLVRLAGIGAGGAVLTAAKVNVGGRGTEAQETHPHWAYEGEEGPEHWGELSPEYATCSGGTEQSPIDVSEAAGADLPNIEFAYQVSSPLHIINNGHTVQVNIPPGSSITLEDKSCALKQFHVHTASEHTIDGRSEAMELHLVHVAEDDSIAVVGVLLSAAEENAALKAIFEAMPVMAGPEQEVTGSVDPEALLPTTRTTYRHAGSLTTPPCTEGVQWLLMSEPREISDAQVAAFRTIFTVEARPVQPINARTIAEDTTP